MVIDTSVLIAILSAEPDAKAFTEPSLLPIDACYLWQRCWKRLLS